MLGPTRPRLLALAGLSAFALTWSTGANAQAGAGTSVPPGAPLAPPAAAAPAPPPASPPAPAPAAAAKLDARLARRRDGCTSRLHEPGRTAFGRRARHRPAEGPAAARAGRARTPDGRLDRRQPGRRLQRGLVGQGAAHLHPARVLPHARRAVSQLQPRPERPGGHLRHRAERAPLAAAHRQLLPDDEDQHPADRRALRLERVVLERQLHRQDAVVRGPPLPRRARDPHLGQPAHHLAARSAR